LDVDTFGCRHIRMYTHLDVHTFGRRRIWIYTHLDVDTFYASDISSNQAPGHYTLCNTLALHCNTLALHSRVTLQHTRVTRQHSRVTLQHSRATLQHSRVTLQHSRVTLQHTRVTLQHTTCQDIPSHQHLVITLTVPSLRPLLHINRSCSSSISFPVLYDISIEAFYSILGLYIGSLYCIFSS